jgi:hypothetical protein
MFLASGPRIKNATSISNTLAHTNDHPPHKQQSSHVWAILNRRPLDDARPFAAANATDTQEKKTQKNPSGHPLPLVGAP